MTYARHHDKLVFSVFKIDHTAETASNSQHRDPRVFPGTMLLLLLQWRFERLLQSLLLMRLLLRLLLLLGAAAADQGKPDTRPRFRGHLLKAY